MARAKIDTEDAAILKYSGLMGHKFRAITGLPGQRVGRGEADDLVWLQQHFHQPDLRVYQNTGKKRRHYVLVYDRAKEAASATMNALGAKVKAEAEAKSLQRLLRF